MTPATNLNLIQFLSFRSHAFAQIKSELGGETREKKSSVTLGHKEQLANWRSQMTPEERDSLLLVSVKGMEPTNLLGAEAAKDLAILSISLSTEVAPKSVSLYLAINEDKVVEEMIIEAVDEAMAAIEARMETKVRKGYQHDNRLNPNMVYAKFVHGETRPVDGIPDPH